MDFLYFQNYSAENGAFWQQQQAMPELSVPALAAGGGRLAPAQAYTPVQIRSQAGVAMVPSPELGEHVLRC